MMEPGGTEQSLGEGQAVAGIAEECGAGDPDVVEVDGRAPPSVSVLVPEDRPMAFDAHACRVDGDQD